MLGNLACRFFLNLSKILSGIHTVRVSNSLDTDQGLQLSGLIWIQAVYKVYQQTIKVTMSHQQAKSYNTFLSWLADQDRQNVGTDQDQIKIHTL